MLFKKTKKAPLKRGVFFYKTKKKKVSKSPTRKHLTDKKKSPILKLTRTLTTEK